MLDRRYDPGDVTWESRCASPDPCYAWTAQSVGYEECRATHLKPVASLPHSCDEWVIGEAKDVEAMIADLTVVLDQMKRRSA